MKKSHIVGCCFLCVLSLGLAVVTLQDSFEKKAYSLGNHVAPLLYAVTIVTVKLFFGFLPRYWKGNQRVMSFANSCSAGVFLASGLIHLLPEAMEGWRMSSGNHIHALVEADHSAGADHGGRGHPRHSVVPFLICAFGFFLTLFLEKVIFLKDTAEDGISCGEDDDHHTHDNMRLLKHVSDGTALPKMALVLTSVLSVHSLVGGVALGVQADRSESFPLFLAIIGHKWVEAMSLGISILRATQRLDLMAKLLLVFASSSPLGIILGWIIRNSLQEEGTQLAAAGFNALASGTFLYIAVMDTLVHEFETAKDKYAKFGCTLAGFTGMAILSTSIHAH